MKSIFSVSVRLHMYVCVCMCYMCLCLLWTSTILLWPHRRPRRCHKRSLTAQKERVFSVLYVYICVCDICVFL